MISTEGAMQEENKVSVLERFIGKLVYSIILLMDGPGMYYI
jgi:hypothetical protein